MLVDQFGFNSREYRGTTRTFRIDDADRSALMALEKILAPHMTSIVDEFYAHLGQFPSAISEAGSSIEKLKKTNPRISLRFSGAAFDAEYFESRLFIGQIHARIGLEPQLFFAGFSTYIDKFLLILKANKLNSSRANQMLLVHFKKQSILIRH